MVRRFSVLSCHTSEINQFTIPNHLGGQQEPHQRQETPLPSNVAQAPQPSISHLYGPKFLATLSFLTYALIYGLSCLFCLS
jgi:hypothetical protein